MKITNEKPIINLEAYQQTVENKKPQPERTNKEEGSDTERVQLSSKAKDLQRIKEVVEATPDVREEKVAAIREKVDNETYDVDAKKVAEKLLKESLIDLVL